MTARPIAAISDEPRGPLQTIREQVASTSLRDVLVEFHGTTEGERLYDAALKSRATEARLAQFDIEVEAVRTASAVEMAEAERVLNDLAQDECKHAGNPFS